MRLAPFVAASLLAASLAAWPGSDPAAASPAPPPWTVTGEARVEGRPLVLARDVEIAAGGHLLLAGVDGRAVTLLPDAPRTILVRSGGRLTLSPGADAATGETVETRLAGVGGAFVLAVEPGGVLAATGATLAAARLVLGGDAWLDGTTALASGARVVGGATRLLDATWEGGDADQIRVEGGEVDARGGRYANASASAFYVGPAGVGRLEGVSVHGSGAYGLLVEGGVADVRGASFDAPADYAVRVQSGGIALRESRLSGHCGLFLLQAKPSVLRGNAFSTTAAGATLIDAAEVEVADNAFAGGFFGLALTRAAATVEGNRFEDVATALVASDAAALVTGNHFAGGGVAIRVASGETLPVLRENAFAGHAEAALRNDAADAVDARWNWWGSPLGPNAPGGEMVSGLAEVDPWLTLAPGAPAGAERS